MIFIVINIIIIAINVAILALNIKLYTEVLKSQILLKRN